MGQRRDGGIASTCSRPSVEGFLDWLTQLPPTFLYAMLVVTAAAENLFPPLPADTIVAFGGFIAARGEATPVGTFLATWIGNVGGALGVYALARRFGAVAVSSRIRGVGGENAERRLRELYGRFGLVAIFLSRFLPGVRALVPPFAGTMRLPWVPVLLAIGAASALWYGLVTYLAYRVGNDWQLLQERIGALTRNAGIVAGAVVLLALLAWLIARHRRRPRA